MRRSASALLFGLAPDGVYRDSRRHRRPGELLPHLFTLAARVTPGWAVCFLWHCPWNRFRWALPSILLRGARTFLGAIETARDRLARSDRRQYSTASVGTTTSDPGPNILKLSPPFRMERTAIVR